MFRFFFAYLIHAYGGTLRLVGNQFGSEYAYHVAVRCFSWAYKIEPEYRLARLDRGILYWRELDKLPLALSDFDALLAEDPQYAAALFNRAMAYQSCGRFDHALNDLARYLALEGIETDPYHLAAQRHHLLLQGLLTEDEAAS